MKWSLAARLRLGFVVAVLLALGVAATAWWITLAYRDDVSHAYAKDLRAATQLAEVESALWRLRYGLPQFMIGSPEEQKAILDQQEPLHRIVEERLAAYADLAEADDEREAATHLRAAFDRFKRAQPKFFELWAAGDREAALAWRALTTFPFGTTTVRLLEAQIALRQDHAEREQSHADANVRLALSGVTAITITLLVMLIAGYRNALRMLRPIRELRAQAQRTVREQLGETVDEAMRGNEIVALEHSFQHMTEHLLAHANALRQTRDRLQFLVSATPVVIYTAAAHGDVGATYVSANVRSLLGYDPEEFTADPGFWASHIHPEDRERVFADIPALFESGEHTHEYRFSHKNGSWRWMRDEAVLTRNAGGAPQEIVGCWLDVTERHRAQEAIQDALRMKTEFMANVTHELRTPLNSVIGFAELLHEQVPGPLNARQAEFAADILASGQRLLALVEGILEMSRLDAAGTALEREPVDIGAALATRAAAHRALAEAQGLGISLELAPNLGDAELDPRALRRMLDALIDNAIKFNREGGRVTLSARRDGDWLEIAVADSGIGIAHADLAKLFQPLVQLDAGLARRAGGIGLGLALARRLAELHGGTIEVASEPDQGSTFTLRLPIKEKT